MKSTKLINQFKSITQPSQYFSLLETLASTKYFFYIRQNLTRTAKQREPRIS